MTKTFVIRGSGLLAWLVAAAMAAADDGRSRFPDRPDHFAPGILIEGDQARVVPPPGVRIRRVTEDGLALTERSEGWEAELYNDAAGYCTIGYGHLVKKMRCDGSEPSEFLLGITKPRGTTILTNDLTTAEVVVMTSVSVPVNDAQFSALSDFVFNVGGANFRKSTLLGRVNAGQFGDVPAQLSRWTKAGGKTFPGLVRRRNDEIALFFAGQPIPRPVPSPSEELSPIDIRTGEPVR
jgi:lysozyme